MKQLFSNAYQDLRVLVTGHSGFKGSWLTAWLVELGAQVVGYSLPVPPTTPSNFVASRLQERIIDIRGDISDLQALVNIIELHRPHLIFHLAAQPIVLHAVQSPKETFDTNAGGTVNILEAVRQTNSVRAIVCITTDKVYKNEEWLWGYREQDRLGGNDPYSASKAMAEMAIHAYRHSFFPQNRYAEHGVAIASARAGNVIGGGDFASYRLVPDCLQALIAGEPIGIRNPLSIRPWQHVLDPLSGYLWLGARLLGEGAEFAEAWNFGPWEKKGITAGMLAEELVRLWGSGSWEHTHPDLAKVETGQLRLSWEKAAARLSWQPVYRWQEALVEIVSWFRAFEKGQDMGSVGREHIHEYVEKATESGLEWAS